MTPPKYRLVPVPELPPARQWMNVKQVASRLDVSRMTVYRLIEGEELRAYRVGRSIKVDVSDFERFVADAEMSWKRGPT